MPTERTIVASQLTVGQRVWLWDVHAGEGCLVTVTDIRWQDDQLSVMGRTAENGIRHAYLDAHRSVTVEDA